MSMTTAPHRDAVRAAATVGVPLAGIEP